MVRALRWWGDQFWYWERNPHPSPVPCNDTPDRSRSVVSIAGAALVLAGAVLVLPGLVVFVDWIAGVADGAFSSRAFCPPGNDCMAASARAGLLGLLAAGVGVAWYAAGRQVPAKEPSGQQHEDTGRGGELATGWSSVQRRCGGRKRGREGGTETGVTNRPSGSSGHLRRGLINHHTEHVGGLKALTGRTRDHPARHAEPHALLSRGRRLFSRRQTSTGHTDVGFVRTGTLRCRQGPVVARAPSQTPSRTVLARRTDHDRVVQSNTATPSRFFR